MSTWWRRAEEREEKKKCRSLRWKAMEEYKNRLRKCSSFLFAKNINNIGATFCHEIQSAFRLWAELRSWPLTPNASIFLTSPLGYFVWLFCSFKVLIWMAVEVEDGSRSQHKDLLVICRFSKSSIRNTGNYVLYQKSRHVFDCAQCHIAVLLSSELAGYCNVGWKGTWRHSQPAMSLLYTDSHQVGLRTVRNKHNTMEVKAGGRACTA